MTVRTTWTATSLVTGTTGTMSSWTDSSIVHSSEYSVYSSLFTEVRLISSKYIFIPVQATNGTVVHGTVVVCTNMLENAATGSNPASYTDVQNGTRPIRLPTVAVRSINYNLPVPGGLEYANIAADAPSPATPWAGSPGTVRWYSTNLSVSTVYFNLHIESIYSLRGRQ